MLTGRTLLKNRYHNKGTAFTDEERDRLGLHGLLPPVVEDLSTQLLRARTEYLAAHGDLARHIFLRALQESNSVLFYRLLIDHLEELLPVVYTPTVGLACQEWSRTYRREHGLYVSPADRDRIPQLLDNALKGRSVDVVVITDGERVLGLGDLGVGGMGIPIGKLALYTAVGGVDPERTLPVFLDAGTENEALLSDPLYLGWRHRRLRDAEYDRLVDAFVVALRDRCPGVLLQWEDFAQRDANRLLARHRDAICSFNDDIQGTAAVAVAAIVGGLRVSATPLTDLRLVIVGAGSAGVGIARQATSSLVAAGLPLEEARRRCWLVDRDGLVHDRLDGLHDFQREFARPFAEVADLADRHGQVPLLDLVCDVEPHALVGVTGQPGLFTESVIRAQAATIARPIVLPLSNPTLRAEAIPADVLAWTDGRALVGTGSPFPPVVLGTRTHPVTQVNNLYLFPGLGRGVIAVGARKVSDAMLGVAATAIGSFADDGDAREPVLLPPLSRVAEVADRVALAVARQAVAEGLAPPLDDAGDSGSGRGATLDRGVPPGRGLNGSAESGTCGTPGPVRRSWSGPMISVHVACDRRPRAMATVLILGAGVSGHTAALHARRRLRKEHTVVVVSPNADWNWIPSNIWVGVGKMTAAQVTFELAPVYRRQGIVFHQAKAVALRPEGDGDDPTGAVDIEYTGEARLGETARLRYDYLINATGPKLRFDLTPGLGPRGNSLSVCTSGHATQASAALEAVIGRLQAGQPQTLVIGTGHGSCTCEGAAFEYVFNVDHVLRERGVRDLAEVIYLSNEHELGDFGVGGMVFENKGGRISSEQWMQGLFAERGIRVILQAHVTEVAEKAVQYEQIDGSTHTQPFDFAMLLPPFRGVGLEAYDREGHDITERIFAPSGFIKVDADYTAKPFEEWSAADWPHTYESPAYPNVFGVGIAFAPPHAISRPYQTPSGSPVAPAPPRTGMPSGTQGKAVAQTIIDRIRGDDPAAPARTASMAMMGAACIASIGAGMRKGAAATITMAPIVPDRQRFPDTGRDPKTTFGEVGLAGHWLKRMLHTLFIYKAKARPGWWLIPE